MVHYVGDGNDSFSVFGFCIAFNDLRFGAFFSDFRGFLLYALQGSPDVENLLCEVKIAPFQRTNLSDTQTCHKIKLNGKAEPFLFARFKNGGLLFGLENDNIWRLALRA